MRTISPAATIVISDGNVTALAGGPISLADLGSRKTRRVSRIEFNESRNWWQVLKPDHQPGDTELANFSTYDEALSWEIYYFNQVLAQQGQIA